MASPTVASPTATDSLSKKRSLESSLKDTDLSSPKAKVMKAAISNNSPEDKKHEIVQDSPSKKNEKISQDKPLLCESSEQQSKKRSSEDMKESPDKSKKLKIDETESKMESTDADKKKKRMKRKALHKAVLETMEFYFSDCNLSKDRFLRKIYDSTEDGYIELSVFKNFNKLQALHKDGINSDTLCKALSKSKFLEVNEDHTKVRRQTPLVEMNQEEVDKRTVYVEHLPDHASISWITKIFSQCGRVCYVSLPKYQTTKEIKGFAFVEFNSQEEAANACKMLNNPAPAKPEEKIGKFPKWNKTLRSLHKSAPHVKIEDIDKENLQNDSKQEQVSNSNKKKKKNNSKKKGEQTIDKSSVTDQGESQELKKKNAEPILDKGSVSDQGEGQEERKKKKKKRKKNTSVPEDKQIVEKNTDQISKDESSVTDKKKKELSHTSSDQKIKDKKSETDVMKESETETRNDNLSVKKKKKKKKKKTTEIKSEVETSSVNTAENLDSKQTESELRLAESQSKPILTTETKPTESNVLCQDNQTGNTCVPDTPVEEVKLSRKERKLLRQQDIRRKKAERELNSQEESKTENQTGELNSQEESKTENQTESTTPEEVKTPILVTEQKELRTPRTRLDSLISEGSETESPSKVYIKRDGSQVTSILGKSKKHDTVKKVEFDPVPITTEFVERKEVRRRKKSKRESLHLRVLSKIEWLDLRAEYIQKQKSHMSKLKESLRALRMQENGGRLDEKEKKHVDLTNVFGTKRMKPSQEVKMAHLEQLEFIPNVIVQWWCSHEINRNKIKTMFKEISSDSIAYIEGKEEAKSGHIRFKDAANAKEFERLSRSSDSFSARVLPESQQASYWEKANQDRIAKLSGKKKERGSDKIARKVHERNKATFMAKGSHVVFDDNEDV